MSTTKVQGDMIDVDGATVAVVAAGDKFNFLDISDSLVKEDTVQGILDLAGGGFTLDTEQATTSGTSFTFNNGSIIPAGTTMIIIMFEGVSLTGTANMDVTIGDADGLETASYINTSFSTENVTHAMASSTAEFNIDMKGASDTMTGTMVLCLKDSTNFTWISSHSIKNGTVSVATGAGQKSLSAELTQVAISGGTFDAGSINVMFQ
jgi:hypothetical protein